MQKSSGVCKLSVMALAKLLLTVLFLFCISSIAHAQCNGDTTLCSRRFDQVCFLYTHNSYNYRGPHRLPNQNVDLSQQMALGVRGFMLDVYAHRDGVMLYHGRRLMGHRPLQEDLRAIKDFLDAHPREVMSIIFESKISAAQMEAELTRAGLLPYLHAQAIDRFWPSLGEMIASGKRLVIFSEKDQGNPFPWLHHIWDFATENHYSNHSRTQFSTRYNRGDTTNALYLMNNFITSRRFGTGRSDSAHVANDKEFIVARCLKLMRERDRFPNFVAVDFADIGESKAAVDEINRLILQNQLERLRMLLAPSSKPGEEILSLADIAHKTIGRPQILLKKVTWNPKEAKIEIELHRKLTSPVRFWVRKQGIGEDILQTAFQTAQQAHFDFPLKLVTGEYELILMDPPFMEQMKFTVR
jgi:hypothetical protein